MEEKNMRKLSLDEMETVAGGAPSGAGIHDLSRFIQRTVCNVIHFDDSSCLPLCKAPNGDVIPGISWQNGDPILIHGQYTEDGWYYAFKSGKYGYVNPLNVR